MWKKLTTEVPLGQGWAKKCRSLKFPHTPPPGHGHCTLSALLYLSLSEAEKCISYCSPSPFLSPVCTISKHSLPFFIALFISIDFEWCAALFCNKDCVPPNTSFHPVTLGDNLRVNILCRSSRFNSAANPISGIVWSSYSGGHSSTDHIWIIQVFCPPPPPFSANDIHYSNWT